MFNLTYFQTDRLSSNVRSDGLLNHISSIFGNSVQDKPASVRAEDGGVVEVAQEVFPDGFRVPVRGVQVSAEVPRQVQQVLGPQDARADVLQPIRAVSQDARVQDAPDLGGEQVAVQHPFYLYYVYSK